MKAVVSPQHRKILVPYNDTLAKIIPNARTVSTASNEDGPNSNRYWLVVLHAEDVVRILRNQNVECPAPIRYYYDWAGTKPFEVQKTTADLLTTNRRAFVFNDIGTGKSRAALYAFDYLKKIGEANRALVIAPLSTLTLTWDREAFENFPHLQAAVVYGERKKRLKILEEPADLYIINHDGVKVLLEELKRRDDIDTIIVDELAVFRNQRTALHRNLKALIQDKKWVWGMTGAPTPTAPTDAWGQARLLTPHRVPRSFKGFREVTMKQVSTFKWIPKPEAHTIVADALQPAVRFTREQCLDLPPITYSDRAVEMPSKAKRAYQRMLKDLVVEVDNGEVKAMNEGVKLNKLLQLATGFVYNEEGRPRYVGGTERLKELRNIIDEAQGKVLVFAPYTFLAKFFGLALSKWHSTGIIHGGVNKRERDQIFTDFQYGSLECIVAHPKTMSHGLTLTAASVIAWASPITSLEVYEQANGRITRAGQSMHAHIMHIVGAPVEKEIYRRLKQQARMQGALLDLLREQTPDIK